jgi:hypothetical protein
VEAVSAVEIKVRRASVVSLGRGTPCMTVP